VLSGHEQNQKNNRNNTEHMSGMLFPRVTAHTALRGHMELRY